MQPTMPTVVPPELAETGKPTLLFFARNTVSSKVYGVPEGMDYGQEIEPAGEYLVVDVQDLSANANPDREYGVIVYRNPLVIDHKNTTSTGWKKDLSERFGGKTGKALTSAIMQAGFDGILTRDAYGYSESVNIAGTKIPMAEYSRQVAELRLADDSGPSL